MRLIVSSHLNPSSVYSEEKKKQKTNVSTAKCLAKTFDILEQIKVKSLRIFKKYSKLARNGSRSLPLRVEELLEDNMG